MALCPMGTTLTITGGNLAASLTVSATEITLPSIKRGAVEVTTLTKPDNAKEFIPGLIEAGDFSCSYFFPGPLADVVNTLKAASAADYEVNFSIGIPDGANGAVASTITFSGFFTETGLDSISAGDNVIKGKLTAKINGLVTYTLD